MSRDFIGAVLGVIALSVLSVCGCSTKDDSVWGRVQEIDSADISPEPRCHGEVPPVVTPGEAQQDSLDQQPDEDSGIPSSD